MQPITFQRGKFFLTCSIVTAAFFVTLMFLDHFNIETTLIAGTRKLLLMPFVLMMLLLPFFLFILIYNPKQPDRKQLFLAIFIWCATIVLVISKIFFIG